MKTISIVYNNRDQWEVIENLNADMKFVFEDIVKVNTYFIEELVENEIIPGDIFVVLYEDRVFSLKDHVSNIDNVIVLSRSINKKYLAEILNIPPGTNVLIVNDSFESTVQTANNFYEIGINHISLIPYNKSENPCKYKNITTAITPDEVEQVPNFIDKIINIGNRHIGQNTFIKIIRKLRLNDEKINRNLIKYMNIIVEPILNPLNNYINNYLKNVMLNKSFEAILLVDKFYNLVYSNDTSNRIFNIDNNNIENSINDFIDFNLYETIVNDNSYNKLVKINDENYIMDKSNIMILDQTVGHSIIFRNEKDIKDLENNLNCQLISKGLFAKYNFSDIIHKTDIMKKCIDISKKAALTDYTVLLYGQSGTGKELLAQSIHNYSLRKRAPFVAVNCAAIPESLLESELFGYEAGAFTGAKKNGKLGLFEQANTGTIFLDEIGDISFNLQSQFLRVLQEKQIMRIGSDRIINVDIRIIAASNKNLEEEVLNGNFRKDLFYRLNIIPINLPPLCDRKDDILLIFKHFLGDKYDNITECEKNSILKYDWPGNIRQLENAANYYMTLGELQHNITDCKTINNTSDNPNIACSVLKIISDNTYDWHGIGRNSIIYELKNQHLNLSDKKARDILMDFQKQGYITIGNGRIGCRITSNGINFLAQKTI